MLVAMKILQYNIFEGVRDPTVDINGKTARQRPVDFIRSQDPDVVCLQEANNWLDDNEKLARDFGERIEMPHFFPGDSNTRFKLGTFSRLPMETHRTRGFTEGFWHSALCTTINLTSDGDNPLDIWNVHLNPHGEDQRLAEAERLRNMIGTSRLALIVGDFNSLSRSDAYDPEMINSLREKGVRKFG